MYETEANRGRESLDQVPGQIVAQFKELSYTLEGRTVLPWSEHCTECVWPTCYSTCDLYAPREDGRCRRFAEGMVRIDCPGAPAGYILKIRFKRWGKLWTPGNVRLRSAQDALRLERRDYWIGTTIVQLPLPASARTFAAQKRYSFKKRMAHHQGAEELSPTAFVLECYNPSSKLVRLSLTMRSVEDRVKIPFQELIELSPGFRRIRIDVREINRFLDMCTPFNIDLVPNEDRVETTLYFGMMDFVREKAGREKARSYQPGAASTRKVKCVVWDLDETIWNGTLVEDGAEKLKLRPKIPHILRTLDERGILHSIASKNNPEEALSALQAFGIKEYFLSPQISWLPKSQSIDAVARGLNLGVDSLLFVDDSEFELQQVKAAHPEVQILNANNYLQIADLDVCQVAVTAESRSRRKMYQVETERQAVVGNFGDDYFAFLRYCNIRLNVYPMMEENLERVHELTQRTNQMNFSGNRYERNVLKQILSTPYLDTYVLDVEDRFGSYGVVGFCIVDNRVPLMTELMFSCRVQSKRVEHAFLAHTIRRYIALTGKDFQANYRRTPRNAPAGQVFSDLRLQEISNDEGLSRLLFPKDCDVPNDEIVQVVVYDSAEATN